MDPSERALLGGSIPIIGIEDEEDQIKVEEISLINYSMLSVIETIGKSNFQPVYLVEINSIKLESISWQREFCKRIIERIVEVYRFETLSLSLDDKTDINNIYSFLEFLEFNSLDFISDIWVFFDFDLRKIDIPSVCNTEANRIISEIEEQINLHVLSEMTEEFLRTYNKEDLIKWFAFHSEKLKIEITLKILRKGENDYVR